MTTFSGDPSTTTLQSAKDWLRDRVDVGAKCPCCTQLAKVYKRKLTGPMAYALILIERNFRTSGDWLHVPSYLSKWSKIGSAVRGGDWAKLVHWKLIEEKPEIRDDGSPRAGYYKITQLGIDFAQGRVAVPKFVYLYDSRVIQRACTETLTVAEALGSNFNYAELMRGPVPRMGQEAIEP